MEKLPVPEAGSKAPDFSAVNQNGETVSLSDFAGKKVVLYFYPKDNTPGCTKEACSLRDNHSEIQKRGAVVLGVSRDGEKSHSNFIEKFSLPFDLLVDKDLTVHKAYGAYGEKNMYGKKSEVAFRYTFVIDEGGIIQKVFKKVKTDAHGEEILNYI
ncbi:thioredoxin-dependent thiol peroxidase [Salinispira pacifica]|uniref:thioredoxin-dependent peroxiredoxin n=1 Tax=Salinispira pacifica TaxID=1307761 RepID=V5WLS8_9SPIO|nr:thioredoxin-dependent thiol peroxidase [Salinispira pacifica]AHC16570.1 Thiol peroxidase, Bcp-type [Salinispira pacifica]